MIMATPPAPNGRTVVSSSTGISGIVLRECQAQRLAGRFIKRIIYPGRTHHNELTLNDNGFLVFAEGAAEGIGDFAEGGEGFDGG